MEITLGFSIMVEGMEEPSFIINLKKNCSTAYSKLLFVTPNQSILLQETNKHRNMQKKNPGNDIKYEIISGWNPECEMAYGATPQKLAIKWKGMCVIIFLIEII